MLSGPSSWASAPLETLNATESKGSPDQAFCMAHRPLSCAARRGLALVAVFLVSALGATRAGAQQRPLVTEDPETIGQGRVLVEAGLLHLRGVEYPIFGLEGNRTHLPVVGVSIGLGSMVELQVDGGISLFDVTARRFGPLGFALDIDGDSATQADDIVVATKIRVLEETLGRPGLGVRLATKLPVARNESGLGTDETDFSVTVLIGKTIESLRIVGNVGLLVAGDPTLPNSQNDPLVYGISLARAVTGGFEVVGELEGRWLYSEPEAPGAENRAAIRGGIRQTWRTVRADAALVLGLTKYEPSWGFTAGLTWVFDAIRTP
jgi:hypothetical protein